MKKIKQRMFENQSFVLSVLFIFVLLFSSLYYFSVRYLIQNQAEAEAVKVINYSQAALTEEDITHFWASSVEGASYDVSTVSTSRLPDLEWSTFSIGSLNPSVFEPILEQKSNNDPFSWVKEGYLWVAAPIEGEQWLLLRYPSDYFKSYWQMFWIGMALFVVSLVCLVFAFYKQFYQMTDRAIANISDGLNRIKQNDYTFTYEEDNYSTIDNLGMQVETLSKHLEKEHNFLSASEQKLSLMLDHINLGVLVIDELGKIELFNPAAASLLKIDDSALGRSYETYIKSYLLANMIRHVMQDRESLRDEIEMFVPNSKYIDVNIVPFSVGSGVNDDSILVLLYDISEIRRLETVRTEFVANASHELRTPVTAIKGFAETLLAGAIDTPKVARQFVEIIANESNRLEIIIHDILELSRVEKQTIPVTVNEFNIVDAAEASVEFFLAKAKAKKIGLTIDADEAVMYKADQHRIEQIFTNLIDNAINYSEENSDIIIKIRRKRKGVQFSVTDNGIGIPENDQERIFERFYRVDKGRSRNSGGTGLGLSIVRNLVKVLNGKIEVESQVGVGSTFKVFLPY
ncbi:two-component system histidine kinase PnpS [Fundicoccus culcitae]|uniref:histidine kinase n=1 Tax=Fundicoccus culcitae TaxID=2969821 RepID=A0ABY5P2I9_9LACT|nr:ATP-binding protein [Fundicoccus culcitae]UUX32932.1 ATP-binding protein [Fundicoccus culcitae]